MSLWAVGERQWFKWAGQWVVDYIAVAVAVAVATL